MTALLLLGPVVAGLALTLLVSCWRQRRRRTAWGQLAPVLGLELSPTRLCLGGTLEGHAVELFTAARGAIQHRYEVTVLRVDLAGLLPSSVLLEREGLGAKVLRLFGRSGEEVGEPLFDAAFRVEGLTPAAEAVLRKRVVQEALHSALQRFERLKVEEGRLQLETYGVLTSADDVQRLVQGGLGVVRAMRTGRAPGTPGGEARRVP